MSVESHAGRDRHIGEAAVVLLSQEGARMARECDVEVDVAVVVIIAIGDSHSDAAIEHRQLA